MIDPPINYPQITQIYADYSDNFLIICVNLCHLQINSLNVARCRGINSLPCPYHPGNGTNRPATSYRTLGK